MKFNVRTGYVVHLATLVIVMQAGREVKQEQTQSYYEGQTVELDADQARDHAHKLEPVDKAAERFLDGLVLANAQPAAAAAIDAGVLATAIAQALAMHAQGAVPAAG